MDNSFREEIVQRLVRIETKVDVYVRDYPQNCKKHRELILNIIDIKEKSLNSKITLNRVILFAVIGTIMSIVLKKYIGV